MNSFWINVKKVLLYKNLEIKELAFRAGVPYSTIINGMNTNSMPHADLALRISNVLNTSIEALLGENDETPPGVAYQKDMEKNESLLYLKNKQIIDALEEIPTGIRDAIKELIFKTRDSLSK